MKIYTKAQPSPTTRTIQITSESTRRETPQKLSAIEHPRSQKVNFQRRVLGKTSFNPKIKSINLKIALAILRKINYSPLVEQESYA